MNYLLRTVVYAGLLGVLGWGLWLGQGLVQRHEAELAEKDARIEELGRQVVEREERIEELQTALQLLKIDHRLARLEVLDQRPLGDAPDEVRTTVSFQEIDREGLPLGPARTYELVGKVAYIDALVIKFEDDYIERGDLWRGTSICLFRRIFGEFQEPKDGFPLDPSGKRPAPYANDTDEGADRDLWLRFWDYANDAELADQAGVRAIHGEAPFIELRRGGRYVVELRSSGGLTIRRE